MPRLVVIEGPNRGAALRLLPAENRLGRDAGLELCLPDEGASRLHASISLDEATGGYVLRDLGSKNGTSWNGVRIEAPHALAGGDEVRIGGTVLLFVSDEEQDRDAPGAGDTASVGPEAPSVAPADRARRAPTRPAPRRALVGEGPAARRLSALVERLAPLDSTVLVVGESGSGKELVAEALHQLGPRRAGAFVATNCATLEPALLESELFGHERGAFTAAVARRVGKLELARGGTLFLDEVGELPLEAQAKLLRALERREFQRVGGTETLATDARLLAATHRDLGALVRERKFREDLLFRLKVVELRVPPLRERREDLPVLVEHFLLELRARIPSRARSFAPDALARLAAYEFPGNVRELRNLVERCLIFAEGERIEAADLPSEVQAAGGPAPAARAAGATVAGGVAPLAEVERAHIERAMAALGGNKTQVALALGIDRVTLYARLRRYGISAP